MAGVDKDIEQDQIALKVWNFVSAISTMVRWYKCPVSYPSLIGRYIYWCVQCLTLMTLLQSNFDLSPTQKLLKYTLIPTSNYNAQV